MKVRTCEGFRMPALARGLMQDRWLGTGVRKPPREETAGRRGAGRSGTKAYFFKSLRISFSAACLLRLD